MGIEFGKLEIVNKTFTRENGVNRTQDFNGIKFRRAFSNKGGVEKLSEKFIFSEKAFKMLDLDNLALTQAKINEQVLLLVMQDIEGAVPPAKFMKSSKKDGVNQPKGNFINNSFLKNDLISIGVLDKEKFGNQFLALTNVTSEITGLPEHIKFVYAISIDTTVDSTLEAKEEATEEAETSGTTTF